MMSFVMQFKYVSGCRVRVRACVHSAYCEIRYGDEAIESRLKSQTLQANVR